MNNFYSIFLSIICCLIITSCKDDENESKSYNIVGKRFVSYHPAYNDPLDKHDLREMIVFMDDGKFSYNEVSKGQYTGWYLPKGTYTYKSGHIDFQDNNISSWEIDNHGFRTFVGVQKKLISGYYLDGHLTVTYVLRTGGYNKPFEWETEQHTDDFSQVTIDKN